MARAHVKLLGPCFKTGRRGRRHTRDRYAGRANEDTRYTSPPLYPPPAEPGSRSSATRTELHPRPRSAGSGSSREGTEKCSRRRGRPTRGVLADLRRAGRHDVSLNLRRPTSRAPPFTTTQFHVLLNSLFKVLFNFPSRYLFAIGLGVIFSLTWSLPRTLSCTPKQLDSKEKPAQQVKGLTGLSPSTGRGPSQGVLERLDSLR